MLLIDIGNTRLKYVHANGDTLSEIYSIKNSELLLETISEIIRNVTKVVACSVSTNGIINNIRTLCAECKIEFNEIQSERKYGEVVSGYDEPERLGVDRWLAIIGAQSLYPRQSILVVDSGTATTVDVIDNKGEHHGGWIMPGIETTYNSVMATTSKVQTTNLSEPSLLFGKNTNLNVSNACWAMTVGAIYEAIKQAEIKLGQLDKVILTGGNASIIADLMAFEIMVEDKLVFHGLNKYKNK